MLSTFRVCESVHVYTDTHKRITGSLTIYSTRSLRFLTVSECAVLWARIRMRSIVALNCYAACSCCCFRRSRPCPYIYQYWLSVCATVLVHIVYYSLRFCFRLLLYRSEIIKQLFLLTETMYAHTDGRHNTNKANAHGYTTRTLAEKDRTKSHSIYSLFDSHSHVLVRVHIYSPR